MTKELGWTQTHYEVVAALTLTMAKDPLPPVIREIYESQGSPGMYDLANEWTDEFEKLNKDRQWDGEFIEEIEAFVEKKLKEN